MIKQVMHIAASFMMLAGAATASGADMTPGKAVVSFVDGAAAVFSKERAPGQPLKKGDRLGKDDEVRVGAGSRVEIRFPDGTVMRLSEKSRLVMNDVRYDRKSENKNLKVNLGVGSLWANVKRLLTPDSQVEVKTGNAVAGVRGTIYRVNVSGDQSALVRVYDGSVSVAGLPRGETGDPPSRISAPSPAPGPHEVAPPMHEVTMEEWHVIVKAMQEVSISSAGAASQPRDFDPKTDADDWVRWNRERDRQGGINGN